MSAFPLTQPTGSLQPTYVADALGAGDHSIRFVLQWLRNTAFATGGVSDLEFAVRFKKNSAAGGFKSLVTFTANGATEDSHSAGSVGALMSGGGGNTLITYRNSVELSGRK